MTLERAALVRWTGRGSLQRFRKNVGAMLRDGGVKAGIRGVGQSVEVFGAEPAAVAELFALTPGVAWVAGGYSVERGGLADAARTLATRYLREGSTFIVLAEATGGALASDIAGATTSAILDSGVGAKVSERDPSVVFRAAFDGRRGVAGVEARQGPGGVATGTESVRCLVSGGAHSGVVSWKALLAGYRVVIVHAKEDTDGVRAVARLYSELSHRVSKGTIELEILEGAGAEKALFGKRGSRCFGGFTPAHPTPNAVAESPLLFLGEEEFRREAAALQFNPVERTTKWKFAPGSVRRRRFAKSRASVSDVLDSLSG